MAKLVDSVGRFLRQILDKLHTSQGRLGPWSQTHKRGLLIGIPLLILAVVVGLIAYHWGPEPERLSVQGTPPGLTPLGDDATPDKLTLQFGGSAAPLDAIDKPVTSGITLSPTLKGQWRWVDESTLTFTPAEDWAVGEDYTVSLDEKMFPDHVLLENYEYAFTTPPFEASLEDFRFYADPADPKIKKAVATVTFTHPVAKADFEKRVHLKLGKPGGTESDRSGEDVSFTVGYDKFGGKAYIHSAILTIPAKNQFMRLRIDPGVHAERGGNGGELLESTTVVPGMFTFFRVDSIQSMLVRDERNNPEQVLMVQVTDGVLEKELDTHLEAYALPSTRPATQGQPESPNHSWRAEEIDAKVLALSQRVALTPIPTEHEYDKVHSFKHTASQGAQVYVRLTRGMSSHGGYKLAEDFDTVVRIPQFPRELSFQYEGSVLSLSGSRKLSIVSRGIGAVRFDIGRVLPTQVNHLISQSQGHFSDPSFQNWNFGEDDITERFEDIRRLKALPPAEPQYAALDLGQYLTAGDGGTRRGLFFVKAKGWDPEHKQAIGGEDRRFVLVTDLGLLVKDNADESHDVFVMDIQSGTPAANVSVGVLGRNGVPVLRTSTDGQGRAHVPSLKGFAREKAPVAYIAQRGDDFSFLPFAREDRQLNLSQFDTGGVYTDTRADTLNAYLFSDRGIYRPGDTFHVAFIIKANDWRQDLVGVPLEYTITDPRGLTVDKRKLTLSDSGFEELAHTTEETSPTGDYQVNLFLIQDERRRSLLGSTTVRVEEFLPDRLSISARFTNEREEGWVAPEALQARVSLKNLYGTAASERRVAAELTLNPAQPFFRRWKDYRFNDPLTLKHGFAERLPDGTTDENGEVLFDLNLQRFEKATYRVRFQAEGFAAEGGRGVSAERSALVSPLAYLVGFKPDGDLGYISRGSERKVHLLAVGPDLNPLPLKGLKAQFIEQQFVSVLARQDDGTYRYQSVRKETTLRTDTLDLTANGRDYDLPTDKAGDYVVVLRDDKDTELNRVGFTVVGDANLSRSLEKTAELQLRLQKTDVAQGEEIQLQIKAPYTGAGVVTIERDRVYTHRWFRADTTSTLVSIPVPDDLEGNGYVHVSFVRALDSEEVFTSPLSYGVAPFTVSRAQRTNAIELDVAELARPGEPLNITYRTDRPGKIVVFAVDEGILQVADYKTPDPLGHFFRKRALQVRTSQILDQILPEVRFASELSAPGGDDEAAEALGKNLNPFRRKRDKPVVFWSGIVEADATSRTLRYDVPDYFAGTLRVMAVAVSSSAVGAVEKRSVIRGPFVLNPNVPTFAAPGDTFNVSVTVANNVEGSGKDAKVDVGLGTSSHLEVVGEKKQTVAIAEGRETTLTFQVRAKNELGSGRFTFDAALGQQRGTQSVELSVRPPVPFMTMVKGGHLTDDSVEVPATRAMYPHFRKREVAASTVPLGLARGLTGYLERYPYGCTEQLVSRAFPAIVLRDRPEFGYAPDVVQSNLRQAVGILRARQNSEGGFGFWAANSHVSDFQSAYAVHFLTEAKERRLGVPDDLLDNGLRYMTAIAEREPDTMNQARESAYAIYLLTRNGQVTTRYLTELHKRLDYIAKDTWRKDLTGLLLAATYKQLKLERDADRLLDKVRLGDPQQIDYAVMYDSLVRDALYVYLVSRHFPERLPDISGDNLKHVVDPVLKGTFNTLSSAYTILALDAYVSAVGTPQASELKFIELLEKGTRPLSDSGGLFPTANLSEPARGVKISAEGEQAVFYQLTEAGFDTTLPKDAIKQRVEVQREFRDAEGKVVTRATLGEELSVHVKVRAVGNEQLSNVAVVDLLPGGFEPVLEPREPTPAPEGDEGDGEYSDEGQEYEGQEGDGGYNAGWPEYVDTREDRVIIFGSIGPSVQEYVYRIRPTNRGTYAVPPAFAEGMYDRDIHARGTGAAIEVEGP